jgi:uncharacterized protein (TIGR02246 family)
MSREDLASILDEKKTFNPFVLTTVDGFALPVTNPHRALLGLSIGRHRMKKRLTVALVALAIGFAVPSIAQDQNAVDPEVRQQIEAVIVKFDEAFNRHDAATIAAIYTKDAVEMNSTSGVLSGRQAIGEKYRLMFGTSGQISEKLVDVHAIGNDVSAIAEWTILPVKGYAATIYVREGDDWKIRMDYINYIIDR